jgi:hypothetical protein
MDDDTAAARLTAYLDARHRWAADEGIELFDCIGYLSPPFDVQLQEGDIRAVLAEDYDAWIAEYRDGEDGPETYSWDAGIAP